MFRIRFHGGGGQGIKTASQILGTAFFLEGFDVQDAPRYGAERRGAPIFAYVRAARAPIQERGVITRPDLVVVADETLILLPAAGILQGLSAQTVLLVNSAEPGDVWKTRLGFEGLVLALPAGWDGKEGADMPATGAMGSAAAGAQGVRDALDILREKGRITADEDMTAVVLAGDGSTYGIGMSANSAAIERGLDFLCICYDNEDYGNTGQQYSAATPRGAKTATSARGFSGDKKDLFAIWVAHRPAYVATVIGAEPLDLAKKIERAAHLKGPRLIMALAPCPTGWDFDPKETVEIGRLAVRTGVWPLKEFVGGRVVHTRIPRPRVPAEEYLRTQGRFAHLFQPRRNEPLLAQIQAGVDAYWAGVG